MKSLLIPIVIIFGLLITGAIYAEEDDLANPADIKQNLITLSEKSQQIAGIKTTKLTPAPFRSEFIAYGKAISIQPLLAIQNRYFLAQAEHASSQARFNLAEQNIKRQQNLYQQGISAKRNLQDQQAQWQAGKGQLAVAGLQKQAILNEAQLNWGKTLAEWMLPGQQRQLEPFLTGQQCLLHITLTDNRQLGPDIEIVYVEPSGDRSQAEPAKLIASAPQTDINSQGTGYFFSVRGDKIKPGMSISAWFPEQANNQTGFIIPKTALIWSMGQAYVYLKKEADKFYRLALENYVPAQNGYFVNYQFDPDQEIVSTGASLLLSEEMRGQLPEEDD